ncbi:putative pentatricopeptide repeat-containing protein-like [Capsicum annuum]|nr:putative pentatricopeptide repeat-containing protein-like [Capsicum annuum]
MMMKMMMQLYLRIGVANDLTILSNDDLTNRITKGSLGYGLDKFAPELADSGWPPIGAQIAKLSPLIRDVITQFGFQEVGHLRESFATVMDDAFRHPLKPPFDAYANDINYLLASYVIPYVGLTGYVGVNPKLQSSTAKRRGREKAEPYGITVEEFTNQISKLSNKLGRHEIKDKGLNMKSKVGVEGRIRGNVLAGDKYSMAYDRTPKEILRIVYGSGKKNKSGGFYPKGVEGRIAKSYLRHEH